MSYEYRTFTIGDLDELRRMERSRRSAIQSNEPISMRFEPQESVDIFAEVEEFLTKQGKQGFRLVQVLTLGGLPAMRSQAVMLIMEREIGPSPEQVFERAKAHDAKEGIREALEKMKDLANA